MRIASTGLVSNLIASYTIWKDAKNFCNQLSDQYILINDKNGLSCFNWMDLTSINQCTESIVIIDCLTEGLRSMKCFRQYRKDHHYIIFSNGDWNVDYWDLKIDYTLVWYPFFLFEMADTYNSPHRFCYYFDKEYVFDYPKSLSFVSTIGNVRPQRSLLVEKILSRLNRNEFILRYSGQDLGIPSDEFDIIKFQPGQFDPYTPIIEKYHHNVSQSLPINIYNQSYFNLIVETDLNFQDSFFLTEKTIKTLIVGQPFVILSNPNHLFNLKKIGFCTFDELWDESYDNIKDFETRADAIITLCEYLSTEFDWQSNKSRFEQIKKHNRSVFQNLSPVIDRCFVDIEKKLQGFI